MPYNESLLEKIRLCTSFVNFFLNSIAFYLIITIILYIHFHKDIYVNYSEFTIKAIFLEILLGFTTLSHILNITRFYIKGWITSFYWISFTMNIIVLISLQLLISDEDKIINGEHLIRFKRCYFFCTIIYFAELFAYLSKGDKND